MRGETLAVPAGAEHLGRVLPQADAHPGQGRRAADPQRESAARQPGMDSSLSRVPPVCPRPRPDSCGTATPKDATSGASGSVILSPTPPVECLSTVGLPSPAKLIRSPEAIIAAVIGGCLLTGGYGSAIGAFFGSIIFGMVVIGLTYTDFDQDWFQVFLGGMLLIAVLFNNAIRKRVTGER